MTAMLPAQLTESVNSLGLAARALTTEIRHDREQRAAENAELVDRQHKQNQRILALLVVVAVLVAGLAFLSISNRRLGNANSELNRQNAQIVERIQSCTTVGGECYEQSNKRTGAIAGNITRDIVRGGVYTQLCLREHPDGSDTQIEACVLARGRKAAERDEPDPSGLGPDGQPTPAPAPGPTPTS